MLIALYFSKYIRLAEYDKRTFPTDLVETDGGGFDKIRQIRVKVERTFRHPGYNRTTRWHDIGIVKMDSDVEYTGMCNGGLHLDITTVFYSVLNIKCIIIKI